MTQQAWQDCLQKLEAWYREEIPKNWQHRPIVLEPPAQHGSVRVPSVSSLEQNVSPSEKIEIEEIDPIFSSKIGLWMQQQTRLQHPILPCICLGQHGFLQKLAQAITDHIIPAQCQLSLPSLDHPLLRLLLVPLPLWSTHPSLQKIYPNPVPHRGHQRILPLHSIEEYLKHPELKRELWTLLLHQFSST